MIHIFATKTQKISFISVFLFKGLSFDLLNFAQSYLHNSLFGAICVRHSELQKPVGQIVNVDLVVISSIYPLASSSSTLIVSALSLS